MKFDKRKTHYRNMHLESQPVACKSTIFRLELLQTVILEVERNEAFF